MQRYFKYNIRDIKTRLVLNFGSQRLSSLKSKYRSPLLTCPPSLDNPYSKLNMLNKVADLRTAEPHSSYLKTSPKIGYYAVGSLRMIELKRLEKYNSLTMDMIEAITSHVEMIHNAPEHKIIVIKSQQNDPHKKRVFCAGGDIIDLMGHAKAGEVDEVAKFMTKEYTLNHFLAFCRAPVIAIMDGITMGGGAGIAMHNAFRVATENTEFAMPETAIGFVPDVGSSFFLPRLDGELGTYLALTGLSISGQDTYHAGIATHYIPSHRLSDVYERLSKLSSGLTGLASILEEFSGEYRPYSLADLRPAIDHCFQYSNLLEIFVSLQSVRDSPLNDAKIIRWADSTLEVLSKRCPYSMATALYLLRKGKYIQFKECLENELVAALEMAPRDDFINGVENKMIKKSNEMIVWSPSKAEEVSRDAINKMFEAGRVAHKKQLPLKFIVESNMTEYLHKKNALPKERDLAAIYNALNANKATDMAHLSIQVKEKHGNKMGIQEHIDSFLKSMSTRKKFATSRM